MTHRIQQDERYDVSPERIYEVLTRAEEFSKMSGGAPTSIDASTGGSFSCFGGMIHGVNVECVPGQRLVQAWRAKTWDAGVYSMVRFELTADGEGTRVQLEHTGFPEGQGEHLSEGWKANYWGPLSKLLS